MKPEIQTCYKFFETWFNRSVATVREEKLDDECSVKISTYVSIDIFGRLYSKIVPPCIVFSVASVSQVEEKFHTRTNFERFDIPVSVCEVPKCRRTSWVVSQTQKR